MKNNDLYVGSTENVGARFNLHSRGRVRSTKPNRPWLLLESQECNTRSEAMKLEKFFKSGQQKELLRRKYC